MTSATGTIYPKVSADDWAKLYNIEIRSRPCLKCGKLQSTSIPWASKEWRGLVSPTHECGEEYKLITAVPKSKAERLSWSDMVYSYKEMYDE